MDHSAVMKMMQRKECTDWETTQVLAELHQLQKTLALHPLSPLLLHHLILQGQLMSSSGVVHLGMSHLLLLRRLRLIRRLALLRLALLGDG
jgi:hypothetical protein